MHARFAQLKIKEGQLERFVKIFYEDMVPGSRALKGFKGVTVLTDEETSMATLISFWETEADARAVEGSAGSLGQQKSKIADLVTGVPDVKYVKAYHEN